MKQGFRYEKDCLSKKEETTCIGTGNSGVKPDFQEQGGQTFESLLKSPDRFS